MNVKDDAELQGVCIQGLRRSNQGAMFHTRSADQILSKVECGR